LYGGFVRPHRAAEVVSVAAALKTICMSSIASIAQAPGA